MPHRAQFDGPHRLAEEAVSDGMRLSLSCPRAGRPKRPACRESRHGAMLWYAACSIPGAIRTRRSSRILLPLLSSSCSLSVDDEV